MAVENKYVNTEVAAGKAPTAHKNAGAKVTQTIVVFDVAAADDIASIYRVIRGIPWNTVVSKVEILNDAIAGLTDMDLGLYESLFDGVGGEVIDKDLFLDGADMSSGRARGSELDGLTAVAIENSDKQLWQLAGETFDTKKQHYDLAITANTDPTGTGTIVLLITLVQG